MLGDVYVRGLLLGAGLLLAGCSSAPSEHVAKKALEDAVATSSKGTMKLVSFEKTNGIAKTEEGVSYYDMEYHAVLEFQKPCTWPLTSIFKGRLETGLSKRELDSLKKKNYWAYYDQAMYGAVGGKERKPGDRGEIKGAIELEKAEHGWRVTHLDVNPIQSTDGK